MNVDCDSHFLPPEVFDDPEVKKFYKFEMNGFQRGSRAFQIGIFGRDFKNKKIPYISDIYGNETPFDPTNFDLKMRSRAMREAGYDRQCLTPHYNRFTASPKAEAHFVRARNDAVARVCEKQPRLIPVADIPHKDPDAAIDEARRCVEDLGFRAIGSEGAWLASHDGPENPESFDWWPFFEAVSKMDVPIFCHPRGMGKNDYWMDTTLPASDRLGLFPGKLGDMFGSVLQAQIGIFGLIYSCVLDKYPNLKFLWLEADAGWVPGYMNTIDGIYNTHRINVENSIDYKTIITAQRKEPVKLRKKPSQYFRDNFLFALMYPSPLQMDTMVTFMVNEAGLQHNLVLESDWPHVEGTLDLPRLVMQNRRISEEARLDICGRNAEKLLKMKSAPSAYVNAF